MKSILFSIALLVIGCNGFAQTASSPSPKALALKHSIFLLTLAGKRSGLDGAFHDIAGDSQGKSGEYELRKIKNLELPDGITTQYLFNVPGASPNYAAELTTEGAQAMQSAITEILPTQKGSTYTSRTTSDDASYTYVILQNGKGIGSLNVKKATGTGFLIIKPAF